MELYGSRGRLLLPIRLTYRDRNDSQCRRQTQRTGENRAGIKQVIVRGRFKSTKNVIAKKERLKQSKYSSGMYAYQKKVPIDNHYQPGLKTYVMYNFCDYS